MHSIQSLLSAFLWCSTVGLVSGTCNYYNCTMEPFAKPIFDGEIYENPESFSHQIDSPGFKSVFNWLILDKDDSKIPSDEVLERTLPVQKPFFNYGEQMAATWLGHATVFVRMDGAYFITDPMWSSRASPVGFAGPPRYRPPPCEIDELPMLDFILISHNHYDHLDAPTIKRLSERFPQIHWFVPVGLAKWMQSRVGNASRVYELSWGERFWFDLCGVFKTKILAERSHNFSRDHMHLNINNQQFNIWAVPAQHNSRRGVLDRNKSLWVGWVVIGPEKRFYYSGDTGFCEDEFRKIGKNLGPFDFSAIPIGCYRPRYIMQNQHVNPEEAVKIHKLVRSKKSLAIHWGTYRMGSNEGYLEPKQLLEEEIKKANVDPQDFFTLQHGQTWTES